MTLERRLREFCPPVLWSPLKRVMGRSARYETGFRTWAEAAAASGGYDAESILARVVAATRKVAAGEAAYERDSVLFDELDCPFSLLFPMLRAMAESGGRLSVLDFGGSLGSTYRQCRPFLGAGPVSWNVIEQSTFVAAGQAEFQTDELKFYAQTGEVPLAAAPNVFLFSSSLQYLDDPRAALRSATGSSATYLVIDRSPFVDAAEDVIGVQHVPRHIYAASYPLRLFAYERMLRELGSDWTMLTRYVTPEGRLTSTSGVSFEYRGLIFRRKQVE